MARESKRRLSEREYRDLLEARRQQRMLSAVGIILMTVPEGRGLIPNNRDRRSCRFRSTLED